MGEFWCRTHTAATATHAAAARPGTAVLTWSAAAFTGELRRRAMPKIVHNISVSGYRSTYCGSLGRLVLGTCGSYGIEQIQLTLEPDWA